MTLVILQPAGSPEARRHYHDTIETPVTLSVMRSFLKPIDIKALEELYGANGAAPTWGVVPGDGTQTLRQWNRVNPGDVVLFAWAKAVRTSATVTHKVRSPQLAELLWKRDSDGQTWEYMYFLDELLPQKIPQEVFNRAVPYETRRSQRPRSWRKNHVIQRFQVLNKEQSADVLAAFDLDSQLHFEAIDESEYKRLSEDPFDPEEPLDAEGRAKRRLEQAFLRKLLFRDRTAGICAICGRKLPVELLVTAHIKKRSRCSPEERHDYQNLVLPMCKIGCDELFERGFIAVSAGKVVTHSTTKTPPDLAKLLNDLASRMVAGWNQGRSPYFRWHHENCFTPRSL